MSGRTLIAISLDGDAWIPLQVDVGHGRPGVDVGREADIPHRFYRKTSDGNRCWRFQLNRHRVFSMENESLWLRFT